MARTDSKAESELIVEIVDGAIAVVTLNRPAARNAVNVAMARAMSAAVLRIEKDPAIRVAILASSHDRVFCAGADLGDIAAGRGMQLVDENGFGGFSHYPRTKPWIAAVRGAALAGGFELALSCDMIIASDDARFGIPETKRGLLAGGGGVYRLPKVVPRNIALEMVATGDPIDAVQAQTFGLVNRVVPGDQVRDAAIAIARSIAANGPFAVRESMAIARIAADHPESELRGISDEASARVMTSADAMEGARAFMEKREPVWSGA